MEFFDKRMDSPDLSRLNERGSKKWVAIMLPEHVKRIREYEAEQKRIPRPILDEFDMQVMEETIEIACKRKSWVRLKIWRNGELHLHEGNLVSVDLHRRTISLDNSIGIKPYKLDEIVDVTILD